MINLKSALEICVFLSIVLSPFDGLNIYNISLLERGSVITIAIGLIFFLITIKKRKIYTNKINELFFLFFLYGILITFFNINNIVGTTLHGYSAEDFFLGDIRFFLLIFGMLIYFTDILMQKENLLKWIYKAIKYSFFIVSIYSFIQILAMLGIDSAINIVQNVGYYIDVRYSRLIENGKEILFDRLSGVSLEPSNFGNYLMVVFPWLCLGAFYFEKSILSKLFVIFAVIFAILSYSRIAYVFMFIEIIVLLFLSNKVRKYVFNFKFLLGIMFFTIIVFSYIDTDVLSEQILNVVISFSSDAASGNMNSNLTRFGMQVAAWNMFMENPLAGVGCGQFRFNVIDYLPYWSYLSTEIQGFVSSGNPFNIGTFNTHLRVLAEMGIGGFLLWFAIAWHGLKNYLIVLKMIEKEKKVIVKFIIVSYIASFMAFINSDVYLVFNYWLLIVLSEVLVYKAKFYKNGNM